MLIMAVVLNVSADNKYGLFGRSWQKQFIASIC